MNLINVAFINKDSSSGASNVCLKLSDSINMLNKVAHPIFSIGDFGFSDSHDIRSSDYLICYLSGLYKKDTIILLHGVWLPKLWVLAYRLKKRKYQYAIFPHGGLVRNSLAKSSIKKMLGFVFLYFYIKGAKFLHFINDGERENAILSKGKDFVIIPNGIELPITADVDAKREKRLVFIGRLDINHKGIDLLLQAICNLKCLIEEKLLRVEFYGDGRQKDVNQIEQFVAEKSLSNIVSVFPNRLTQTQISHVLTTSKGFMLTSRYEGEPLMVINALFNKCPVFVSEDTNCGYFIDRKSGIICQTNVSSITAELKNFICRIDRDFFNPTIDVSARSWLNIAKLVLWEYGKRIK